MAKSANTTGYLTWHLPSTSFERRTASPLVGPKPTITRKKLFTVQTDSDPLFFKKKKKKRKKEKRKIIINQNKIMFCVISGYSTCLSSRYNHIANTFLIFVKEKEICVPILIKILISRLKYHSGLSFEKWL